MKRKTNEYIALHNWVRYHKGTPSECEECGTTTAKRYEWSNISGKYERVLSDYRRLCASCHRLIDYGNMCMKKLHELVASNTYTTPDGRRVCKACRLATQRRFTSKYKERQSE